MKATIDQWQGTRRQEETFDIKSQEEPTETLRQLDSKVHTELILHGKIDDDYLTISGGRGTYLVFGQEAHSEGQLRGFKLLCPEGEEVNSIDAKNMKSRGQYGPYEVKYFIPEYLAFSCVREHFRLGRIPCDDKSFSWEVYETY